MCPNRAWRFLLIASIPAALTAALLVAFSNSGRCHKTTERSAVHRAAPPMAADPSDPSAPAKPTQTDQKKPTSLQSQPQNTPSFTQLTSWNEGRNLRAWFAQHSGETCISPDSAASTCRFVKPRRLSVVIPEASDPSLDAHLPILAATLSAAPPDVQVDIIHYRRSDDVPLRYVQPTDVADLMLCAKLSLLPQNLYQSCINALSPRLESSAHKPAHFWQVTLATTSNSPPPSSPPLVSLEALLSTLQPQSQSALILVGHWDLHEILTASKYVKPFVHLTVISDQLATSTKPTKLAKPTSRQAFAEPLSTPASLAALSTQTLDSQAVSSAVWRRFQPHPASASRHDCAGARPAKGSWYQRYLRVLVLWYSVGLICLFALWSARRRFAPAKQPPSL